MKDIERRLLRGERPSAIVESLRAPGRPVQMNGYPTSLAWIAAIHGGDGGEGMWPSVTLELAVELPATAVVAELGHFEQDTPIHFREDGAELMFDPTPSPYGELQITAAQTEPGLDAPQGTIRWFQFTLHPPPHDAGVDAGRD
ncbi:MAG TPA: hypothetical protein VHE35_32840 [Kofleriaceae bacterium]|nr:hypothetical protein [Kofleriaceae bacterium]